MLLRHVLLCQWNVIGKEGNIGRMNGKENGRKSEEPVQLPHIEHSPHESAGTRSGGLYYSSKFHFNLAENC